MAEERGEGWPVNGHMTHLNLETFGLLKSPFGYDNLWECQGIG
jgi:hypothetical protein